MWHHATIRGIICNLTYTGILRSGESRSPVLPHLQIIDPELFEAAQRIRTNRANAAEKERTVPRNIGGQSLLSGNVFCGHCGARLTLTTSGKAYPCKDDPHRVIKRVRYICYQDHPWGEHLFQGAVKLSDCRGRGQMPGASREHGKGTGGL